MDKCDRGNKLLKFLADLNGFFFLKFLSITIRCFKVTINQVFNRLNSSDFLSHINYDTKLWVKIQ